VARRPYRVEVTGPAARDLVALAKRPPTGNLLQRIDEAILSFADAPRPPGAKKLSGQDSIWRLRVGDYRILYEVGDQERRVELLSRVVD
jgi:mRNA interferase RelE/StbE